MDEGFVADSPFNPHLAGACGSRVPLSAASFTPATPGDTTFLSAFTGSVEGAAVTVEVDLGTIGVGAFCARASAVHIPATNNVPAIRFRMLFLQGYYIRKSDVRGRKYADRLKAFTNAQSKLIVVIYHLFVNLFSFSGSPVWNMAEKDIHEVVPSDLFYVFLFDPAPQAFR
jgi:hypothetical protein